MKFLLNTYVYIRNCSHTRTRQRAKNPITIFTKNENLCRTSSQWQLYLYFFYFKNPHRHKVYHHFISRNFLVLSNLTLVSNCMPYTQQKHQRKFLLPHFIFYSWSSISSVYNFLVIDSKHISYIHENYTQRYLIWISRLFMSFMLKIPLRLT